MKTMRLFTVALIIGILFAGSAAGAPAHSAAYAAQRAEPHEAPNAAAASSLALTPGPNPGKIATFNELTLAVNAQGRVVNWGKWGRSVQPAPIQWINLDGVVKVTGGGVEQTLAPYILTDEHIVYDSFSIDPGGSVPKAGLEPGVIDIATGATHSCAVMLNHTVRCWGGNWGGSIGVPTANPDAPEEILTPTVVSGVTNAVAVSVGFDFSCALTSQGQVLCWGANGGGQLGQEQPEDYNQPPTQPQGLGANVARIASSGVGYFSCAILVDGTVRCWGWGGLVVDSKTPVQIDNIAGAALVTVGRSHACVAEQDNEVKCWGENPVGQLGNGTLANSSVPVLVQGLNYPQIEDIQSGDRHTCIKTVGGNIKCWGLSGAGELGDGQAVIVRSPTPVDQLPGPVAQIAVGEWSTCARTQAGEAYCWGDNLQGQLGNGSNTPASLPSKVPGFTSPVADVRAGSELACALTTAGEVKCWGTHVQSLTPSTLPGLETGVIQIGMGGDHACALKQSGAVLCVWGNWAGQSGGTDIEIGTPTVVPGMGSGVAQIAIGNTHSCARKASDGSVWCWGDTADGQLGEGVTEPTATPQHVVVGGAALSGMKDLSAAGNHTCATRADDSVVCWGEAKFMDLWNAGTVNRADAMGAFGHSHTCILTTAGGVQCTGKNMFGQLGTGDDQNADTGYVDTLGLASGVLSLGSGGSHNCALLNTGVVKCWGLDDFGALGDGIATYRLSRWM